MFYKLKVLGKVIRQPSAFEIRKRQLLCGRALPQSLLQVAAGQERYAVGIMGGGGGWRQRDRLLGGDKGGADIIGPQEPLHPVIKSPGSGHTAVEVSLIDEQGAASEESVGLRGVEGSIRASGLAPQRKPRAADEYDSCDVRGNSFYPRIAHAYAARKIFSGRYPEIVGYPAGGIGVLIHVALGLPIGLTDIGVGQNFV